MRWAVGARFSTGFCVLPGSACAARDHFRTRLRSMCVCSDVWVLVRNCRARARTIMRHAGNGARRGPVSCRVRYHVTTRAAARRAQAPYAMAREGARRNAIWDWVLAIRWYRSIVMPLLLNHRTHPDESHRLSRRAAPQRPVRSAHGLTQRGRGEHLFWIHTQSPPPDFGLSD